MIIKPKKLPAWLIIWFAKILSIGLHRSFNKLVINQIEIKPNCSYLLMCNHFSFWDGFLGGYLSFNGIHKKNALKGIYIMILKKQLKKNMWMRYFGTFSIAPYSNTAKESLSYAADILSEPGNVLLMYPQANLESMHVRQIDLKPGIEEILSQVKGNCQIIWSSNLVEYFESLKPSVYFNMLDCGTNTDFNFDKFSEEINQHHRKAIQSQLRFTRED